jgi:hypothetical protein
MEGLIQNLRLNGSHQAGVGVSENADCRTLAVLFVAWLSPGPIECQRWVRAVV